MRIPKINISEFTKLISLDPWEINPVGIEEFVLSPKYLNLGRDIYPRIFDILCKIFGNNPKEFYTYSDVNLILGIGCLAKGTLVIDSQGNLHDIASLVDKEIEILAIDTTYKSDSKIVKAKARGKFSGFKNVLILQTESGRIIRCTPCHLFLTDIGWKRADELKDRAILVSNKLPLEESSKKLTLDEIYNLRHYIHSNKPNKNAKQEMLLKKLPSYSSESLNELLQELTLAQNELYNIYPFAPYALRSVGQRTGNIISQHSESLLRFKLKNNSINPLYFDKVVSISKTSELEEETFDLEVPEYENFILADGTVVHNSGKTYLGGISQTYLFYKLACLKDPRRYFGGAEDKPMTLANCAPSAQKAQKLVFQSIKDNVSKLEMFKNKNVIIQSKEIKKFNSKGNLELNVYSGASTPNSVIGFNLFSTIIDEACFFERSSDKDYYEDLYKGVKARISSRFGDNGFVLTISSPRNVDDYAWKMLEDARSHSDTKKIIIPKRFKEQFEQYNSFSFE